MKIEPFFFILQCNDKIILCQYWNFTEMIIKSKNLFYQFFFFFAHYLFIFLN